MIHLLKRRLGASGVAMAAACVGFAGRAADYPSTVLMNNPLAYFRFSETNPAPAALVASNLGTLGSAANGYAVMDPGIAGSMSGYSGVVGNCYQISNPGNVVGYSGPKVDVPWNAALNPQGSFTAEFWAKPAELVTGLFCPLSSLDGDGGYRFGWLFYQTPTAGWMFRLGGGSGYAGLVQANNTATANQWQQVVGVYDDGAKTMSLYVNGVLVAGPTPTGNPFQANVYNPVGNGTGRALRIGGTGLTGNGGAIAGNRGFDGLLDEVAIYPAALSADRIAAHYTAATSNPAGYRAAVLADAPAGYWPLDEPTYTVPDPSTYLVATNSGSLGAAANGAYTPGITTGGPGPEGTGFGPNNTAIWGNGAVGGVGFTNVDFSGDTLTLTAWVNPSLTDNLHDIVAHGFINSTDVKGEVFLRLNGDQYEAGSWDGTSTYSVAAPIPDGDVGNWVFLAATYDGASWNLYRYDQLLATAAQPKGAFAFDANWGVGSMGSPAPLDGRFFGGGVDEVAIFDSALTSDQLGALFYSAHGVPILTLKPTPPAGPVFEGSALNFAASAAGQPPLAFQWTKNGAALPGQTFTNLSLGNVLTNDTGLYAVVVTNPNGSTTNEFQVTVVKSPPFIKTQPLPASRFAGAPVSFSATAGGASPLSYQWYHGGNMIAGATSNVFTIPAVQAADGGAYSVTVTNPVGSTNSASVQLLVIPDPAGYGSLIAGDGPLAYYRFDETNGTVAHDLWNGIDGQYFGATLGVPGFSILDPDLAASFGNINSYVGQISGTAIDFSGPNAKFTLEAWVNGAAVQAVDGAGIIAKGPGNNGGNGDEQFAIDVFAQTYRFYVRAAADNAATEIKYTVPPDGTWQHIVATYDGPGTSMTLYVNGVVQGAATAPASGPRLSSHPVSIGARRGGVDPKYDLFFTGAIDEVAIYNKVLTQAQVLAHFNAQYGSHVPPQVAVQPAPVTTYETLPLNLSVAGVGSSPITYQWFKGPAAISGATASTYSVAAVTTNDSGGYYAVVGNPLGYATSVVAQVTVLPVPTTTVQTPDLVLHLPFDGTTADTSGRANHGVQVNGPTFVGDPKVGSGGLHYETDATVKTNVIASYVTLGVRPDLQFSSNVDFTVAFWIRLPVNYANNDLPFIGNATNSTFNFGWVLDPTSAGGSPGVAGGWAYSFLDQGLNGIGVWGDAGSINDGSWHHLAYVFNRTRGATVYLDGFPAHGVTQSGTSETAAGVVDTGAPLTIGQDPSGKYAPGAEADSADMDDLGIWRRALTSQEIGAIFTAGNVNGLSFAPAPTIAPAPGGKLTVTFGPGGTLKSSTSLSGPYNPVAGAVAPTYTFTPSSSALFYRVSY